MLRFCSGGFLNMFGRIEDHGRVVNTGRLLLMHLVTAYQDDIAWWSMRTGRSTRGKRRRTSGTQPAPYRMSPSGSSLPPHSLVDCCPARPLRGSMQDHLFTSTEAQKHFHPQGIHGVVMRSRCRDVRRPMLPQAGRAATQDYERRVAPAAHGGRRRQRLREHHAAFHGLGEGAIQDPGDARDAAQPAGRSRPGGLVPIADAAGGHEQIIS